uniref:Uncharacterized protein n=1 Tax=Arundo donax TaxID=35708 RepID=A0A0A9B0S0_ARUDO
MYRSICSCELVTEMHTWFVLLVVQQHIAVRIHTRVCHVKVSWNIGLALNFCSHSKDVKQC